ncbi:MAG: hypothetical protein ACTSPW_19085, partial [Promethearchaeota archaeon]
EVIEKVREYLIERGVEDITEEEFKKEFDSLKEFLKDFHKKNIDKADKLLINEHFAYFINAWYFCMNRIFTILSETTRALKNKKKRLLKEKRAFRKTERILEKYLEDLFKAIFLVLFRIVEQIFMISQEESIVFEKEIDYLFEDLVYLENISRKVNDALS